MAKKRRRMMRSAVVMADREANRPTSDPNQSAAVAPWPQIDRFPILIGTNITFSYIASVMRLALTGYRLQLVDLLGELLDAEPHGFSEIFKRVVHIACGRLTIKPYLPEGATEADEAQSADIGRRTEIADECRRQIAAMPMLHMALARLAWGIYYGLAAEEILWKPAGAGRAKWEVDGLQFIHSRRLAYPDQFKWELHIWDQGMGGGMGSNALNYGFRLRDFPNKFVVFSPQLRGDYPTREGLGRILIHYFALKRMVVRVSAQDFERFIKPWVVAYYATGIQGAPRVASEEDIAVADAAMRGAGVGSLAGLTLPDSIRLELLRAATEMSAERFLEYLDSAISKAVSGQAFTSEPGRAGARAASQVSEKDSRAIDGFIAAQLADTLRHGLIAPIVRLNFPGEEDLLPLVELSVEETPDPRSVAEVAGMLADKGAPVDARKVGQATGVPMLDEGSKGARMAPLAPVDISRIAPGIEPPPVAPATPKTAPSESAKEQP